jgi:hypothetical protein
MTDTNAIDIVLPWVDGDDPTLSARRMSYMNDGAEAKHEDIAGSSRYKSLGEIQYCIASINIFAPFVRKIFIVTDGQDPKLEPYLNSMFPNGYIPIEIVDHKVIFKGYEQYLPVFNSRAIETLIWKIPGLSERFILMNDDFFFIGKVTEEDFFRGEKSICYADWFSTSWAKFLRWIKPKKQGHKTVGFKDSMLNAISLIGNPSKFLCLGHTPRALRKSFYENFYKTDDEALIRNISHKFRHESQFNSQELFYMSEYKEGRVIQIPVRSKCIYFKARKKISYIDRKLRALRANTTRTFCCLNALNLAPEAEQQKVLRWAEDMLNQNLAKPL